MKMKLKRSVSILLALAMGLSLCACEDFTVNVNINDGRESGISANEVTDNETVSENGTANENGGGVPWIDSALKSNLTEDMELSVKDDFHLAVNHDWLMNAEIKEGYHSHSSFVEVDDKTRAKALEMLNDDTLTGHDAKLVQTYYKAILDWDARDKAGIDPIMDTVKEIQDIDSLDAFSDFICDADKTLLVPCFIDIGNTVDYNDADSYITAIVTGSFLLGDSAEYVDRTDTGNRYYEGKKKVAVSLLTRIGYTEEEAEGMYDDVIGFEGRWADIALTSADRMSPDFTEKINNRFKPEDTFALAHNFPLKRLVESEGYGDAPLFLVTEPEVIGRLDELYTEDNLELLKDYTLVRYVVYCSDILDSKAYDAYTELRNIISGSTGREPDEKYAYDLLQSVLYTPLDKAYLEKYDATETKKRVTKICEDVVSAYRDMLSQEEWLSEETRNKAIEKLDALKINAVYPDKWENYDELELDGLSLFDCYKEIMRYLTDLDVQKTGGKVDHDIWGIEILDANAYYDPQDNSINIILGLLGEPFYYDGMPDEALYGGIGAAIGHEISHAFDTSGAQYDKDGNLYDWWTEEDYSAFTERADKLIAYYDNITVWEGQNAIGNNVQGEVIADMAGIKAMLMIAANTPDFDYDEFFRSYAGIWRRINSREYEELCLLKDPHPLTYLRTNVTLQQFDEFLETYDIREGDNMYLAPEDRISVW